MARQTWAQLATLLADNTAGAISAEDLRAAVIDSMRPHEAAGDPTTSNDETEGFDVGHQWRNTSSGEWFRCADPTTGSAVWEPAAAGEQGPQGEDGLSAYEVAVAEGFEGDEAAWLASLVGEKGDKGDTGDQGPAGEDGEDGIGVPAGGTTGQVLKKASGDDYDTEWVDESGGGDTSSLLPKLADVNSYAGNRTLDGDDSGAYVRITAAGTVTLPDSLSTGFQCVIVNATDSDTVALSAATTLVIPSGFDAEVQNRRAVTVIHVGSNVWEAHGALVEEEA